MSGDFAWILGLGDGVLMVTVSNRDGSDSGRNLFRSYIGEYIGKYIGKYLDGTRSNQLFDGAARAIAAPLECNNNNTQGAI